MRIKVEVKNKLLGNSIFWEGDETEISRIRNIPARELARRVILDGDTRKFGMWIVSKVEENA